MSWAGSDTHRPTLCAVACIALWAGVVLVRAGVDGLAVVAAQVGGQATGSGRGAGQSDQALIEAARHRSCGCRKPVSPGWMLWRAQSGVQCRASRSRAVRTCDDLRLVGLKLIFFAISSAMSLLRLSRREDWWKDAEILMLRHQLAVALRGRPRAAAGLTWPDRAWLALLADAAH